jgi:hypothetical protein
LIGLGSAITGGVFLAVRNGGKSIGTPVVVLMDSPVSRAVYDEDEAKAGKTNAEVLQNRVLNSLPLRCVQFTISDEASNPNWRGENSVIGLQPRLVLLHRSAFFHPVNSILGFGYPAFDGLNEQEKSEKQKKWDFLYGMSDEKLVCFMGHVATVLPGTKFLIYSRGTDVNWTDDGFRDRWKTNCEARFPALKDCVYTMLIERCKIPGSEKGSFRDAKTAAEIRDLVKDILGLAEKNK